MGRSGQLRLGRVAGIEIDASWSVLAVVALVAWSLAGSLLPSADAGRPAAVYWAVGVVTAIAFLVTLLLHELAHSVVARRADVPVDHIVLWMFGGISQFGRDPSDADDELRIALAGPATSVALGALLFGVAGILSAAGVTGVAVAAFAWLGGMNLLLAAFNLLPAFPLDGGRVLRAWLWVRRGDKVSATVTAARVGRVAAFALTALGLFELWGGRDLGGLWLVFLGWFLLGALASEASAAVVASRLGGVTVEQHMTADPVTVTPDVGVDAFVERWVYAHRCSSFPVVAEDGALVGLVTLTAVKRLDPSRWSASTVADIATPRSALATCRRDEQLAAVVTRMNGCADHRAIVLDGVGADERVVGIVSPIDVSRALERADLALRAAAGVPARRGS